MGRVVGRTRVNERCGASSCRGGSGGLSSAQRRVVENDDQLVWDLRRRALVVRLDGRSVGGATRRSAGPLRREGRPQLDQHSMAIKRPRLDLGPQVPSSAGAGCVRLRVTSRLNFFRSRLAAVPDCAKSMGPLCCRCVFVRGGRFGRVLLGAAGLKAATGDAPLAQMSFLWSYVLPYLRCELTPLGFPAGSDVGNGG